MANILNENRFIKKGKQIGKIKPCFVKKTIRVKVIFICFEKHNRWNLIAGGKIIKKTRFI